jgi:ABC-type proline/glycine betaine transport system substrate-binding protein
MLMKKIAAAGALPLALLAGQAEAADPASCKTVRFSEKT